jgi:hypothetical protein
VVCIGSEVGQTGCDNRSDWFYYYLSCSSGESRLPVSWCVGDMCSMVGSDEDHGRSRRPGAEDRGWSSIGRVLDGRMIKRSGDVMCGLHYEQGDMERMFLGLASKTTLTVSPNLT